MGSRREMASEDHPVAVFAVERLTGDAPVTGRTQLADQAMARSGF
jgi:hypothetical protein